MSSEPDNSFDTFTYYYLPRGYLHENLRSNVLTDVTKDMEWDVVMWSNKGLCAFGGVSEGQREEE